MNNRLHLAFIHNSEFELLIIKIYINPDLEVLIHLLAHLHWTEVCSMNCT